ncbi:hypothetical protein BTHE68_70960 (plasmid) [Burkholderia sp. THE68]|uniref:hypothetical protein n=1 Tax=Burkholderia sp. THE68 TaxID=758782 RepID=UPI0013172DF9|nr:hypothetical protein [Burkholderia sp. THE68]BBU33362.1 hypothetical protein BTHE68_70960 [Burkholderia sp. THE68]
MSNFTVVYAVNVPHYGKTQIEAATAAEAIAVAKHRDPAEICTEHDHSSASCARIVSIFDDAGRSIAEGVTLDGAFIRYGGRTAWLLCEASPALLESLQRMVSRSDDLVHALVCPNGRNEHLVERLSAACHVAKTVIAAASGEN